MVKSLVTTLLTTLLIAGTGCSKKPTPPHDPIDMSIHPTKGEQTPWEVDYRTNPENYPNLTLEFPRDLEVLEAFYEGRETEILLSNHKYSGNHCQQDTCPRDYFFVVKVWPQDRNTLEADGFEIYHGSIQ